MKNLVVCGSDTAKSGFKNERVVASKFNNWKDDEDSKNWLKIMGYDLSKIESVKATVITGYKADVNVVVTVNYDNGAISKQNISVKKSMAGFSQIDKRPVNKYAELWNIPEDVIRLLKLFDGEIKPIQLLNEGKITREKFDSLKDKRRFIMTDFTKDEQDVILDFIKSNKIMIIADVLKGRGEFSADWMIVTKYKGEETIVDWVLKDINTVMSFYGDGDIKIGKKKSTIHIGKISIQRKGGDGGRETGNMLQFKFNPLDLFNCD